MMSHPTAHLTRENEAMRAHMLALREAMAALLSAVKTGQTDERVIQNAELELARTNPDGVIDPILVQIGLEGGLVQGVTSNYPLEAVVFDYDTEGADDDELTTVPQSGSDDTTEAYVTTHDALVDKSHALNIRRLLSKWQD